MSLPSRKLPGKKLKRNKCLSRLKKNASALQLKRDRCKSQPKKNASVLQLKPRNANVLQTKRLLAWLSFASWSKDFKRKRPPTSARLRKLLVSRRREKNRAEQRD